MNQAIISGVVLAVGAFLLFSQVLGGSGGAGAFVMQGKAKFWDKSKATELHNVLAKLRATPHSSVERIWVLGPTGPETALARVNAIQQAGHVATSTLNLLDGSGPMGLGELTPAEFMNLSDPNVAVLPVV